MPIRPGLPWRDHSAASLTHGHRRAHEAWAERRNVGEQVTVGCPKRQGVARAITEPACAHPLAIHIQLHGHGLAWHGMAWHGMGMDGCGGREANGAS